VPRRFVLHALRAWIRAKICGLSMALRKDLLKKDRGWREFLILFRKRS
jgi:hypothetical protein